MSLPLLAILVAAALALGYRFYGGLIARQYALDPSVVTPATTRNDGVDFVPTRPFYLFGQHFSAIAAAGPIAGPIIACQGFGWLPCVLWIVLGSVLIGAVHDFSTLVASVRHVGRSIAGVVRDHFGPQAWVAILAFIWLALVYVIVAFVDVTATTFVAGDRSLVEIGATFDKGGAVAMASTLYLGLAVLMGVVERWLAPPLWLQTLIFVPATLGAVWLGTELSTVLTFSWRVWTVVILGYCFVASLAPVWSLLQPRGYLGGFVLYMAIGVGVIGILFGGHAIAQPAFKGFSTGGALGDLFPFLFVTIACGACSGFHGLVCSGTTSKQIAAEPHCRSVGYGAMLLEAFVALIALGTIMIVAQGDVVGRDPGTIYAQGIGRFATAIVGERYLPFAITFGAMAFSTFVFDTIDVGTRLGRYILQELVGLEGRGSALLATALTVGAPLAFLLASSAGRYRIFWGLFGTANQLLAGLSLMAISVWLKRSGRRCWYTAVPMVFVMAITLWSLVLQAQVGLRSSAAVPVINGVVSLVLIGLAVILAWFGWRAAGGRPTGAAPAAS
jgi:carbon starvation protein